VERGTITPDQLRRAQAERFRYSQAMAGYLQFVAQRFDALQAELPARFQALRTDLQVTGSHRREPGQVAHLLLGLETFLDFAVVIGVITVESRDARLDEAREILLAHASEHADSQAEEAPEQVFLRLLAGGFAGKRAYLEHKQGGVPSDPEQWGWERRDGDGWESAVWQHPASAQLVGVVDDDWLLLYPEPAYQFVAGAARNGGRVFPIEEKTLVRRLDEAGLLATEFEGGKRRRKVNVYIGGRTQRVLKLRADALDAAAPSKSGEEGEEWEEPRQHKEHYGEGCSQLGGNGPECGKTMQREIDGAEPNLPTLPTLPTSAQEEQQARLEFVEVGEWSR
jgi:hypothetical protein